MTRIVVIGYGMAGARFVDEVRQRRGGAELTIFGAEASGAYNRVLLSSVLAGTTDPSTIRLGPREPRGAGYDVRAGVTVTGIDRATKQVVCDDGTRTSYDTLVLATGSRAWVPPIDGLARDGGAGGLIPGAVAFRTLEDCRAILAAAHGARRAIVLGGGLLGLEAARGLAARGLQVEVLHRSTHVMDRQLDARGARVLAASLADLGITIRTGARTTGVTGDDRVDGVVLDDGTHLPADVLVVSCGVRAETVLARGAGLTVDQGVVVDDCMRTVSDRDVFAIGECSQHEGTVYGLVAPAWEQASVAADVITGTDSTARYRGSRLVTRLKAKGIELATMGEGDVDEDSAPEGTHVVQFSDLARRTYKKLVVRDGRLVGAVLIGDTTTAGSLTQHFDRQTPVPSDPLPLLFTGMRRAGAADEVDDPAHIPDRATVCRCNGVTKGAITACFLKGGRSTADVAKETRATTGCGSCAGAVDGIVAWLAAADPFETPVASRPTPLEVLA